MDMLPRPKRMDPVQERLYGTLVFLLRLCILSIPVYLVLALGIGLYPLQLAAAGQAEWVFGRMGMVASREGAGMTVQGFSFLIDEDCTAWKPMLFLAALIVAVPAAGWRKRLMGVAVGIPLLWAANLLRIVTVVLAQQSLGTEAALFLHDWVWQLLMVGVALWVWLCWLLYGRARISDVRQSLRRAQASGMRQSPAGRTHSFSARQSLPGGAAQACVTSRQPLLGKAAIHDAHQSLRRRRASGTPRPGSGRAKGRLI
jgi:exosortase/archaeosortase family protein